MKTPIPPFWLLVLIALSGTIGIHIFVPALHLAARGLGAAPGAMQLTIGLYILGLALGQLVYGPLSDALGRVPVLRAGLLLYVAGSIACALAPSLPTLLAGRLAQAFGAAAGLVLGRAIVRDTTEGPRAMQRLAVLNLLLVLSPSIAPALGGLIAMHAGWRAIFAVLAAIGAATLVAAWIGLPETRLERGAPDLRRQLADYALLARTPRFAGLAVCMGCSLSSIYAFLSASPFIFGELLHQPPQRVGLYAGLVVAGTAAGNALAARLAHRLPATRLLLAGNLIALASITAMLAMVLAGRLSVAGTLCTMALYTFGGGLLGPAAMGRALDVMPRLAGSAAGLFGATQLALGGACSALATLGPDPALAASLTMLVANAAGLLAAGIALHPRLQEKASP